MEALFNLREAAQMLGWRDWRTVRLWMHRVGIVPASHPHDTRHQLLTAEQIERIRRYHAEQRREGQPVRGDLVAQLLDRVAALEARVRALEGQETAPRARRAMVVPSMPHEAPASSQRHVEREGRATLPAGYISESRYVDYHSRDLHHPIQTRSLQRLAAEGTLPAREQPPEGMVWRSEAGQRVRHAFSREAHLAISRFAAREWPDLFQPCAECRAAVAEEVALTAVARASGEP